MKRMYGVRALQLVNNKRSLLCHSPTCMAGRLRACMRSFVFGNFRPEHNNYLRIWCTTFSLPNTKQGKAINPVMCCLFLYKIEIDISTLLAIVNKTISLSVIPQSLLALETHESSAMTNSFYLSHSFYFAWLCSVFGSLLLHVIDQIKSISCLPVCRTLWYEYRCVNICRDVVSPCRIFSCFLFLPRSISMQFFFFFAFQQSCSRARARLVGV